MCVSFLCVSGEKNQIFIEMSLVSMTGIFFKMRSIPIIEITMEFTVFANFSFISFPH